MNYLLDVHYLMIAFIPMALVGGWAGTWMTSYSYMSNNTPKKYRYLKFLSWTVAVAIADPTGIYIGGKLLGTGNYETGSLHNYEKVFLASTGCAVVSFFWVLFLVNETHMIEETTDLNQNDPKSEDNQVSKKFQLSQMFDWRNVVDIFKTAFKARPNRGRIQILFLLLSMCMLNLTEGKVFGIVFPFVEKVYGWNAKHYSDMKSISSILQIVAMAVIPSFLSSYLKLQ